MRLDLGAVREQLIILLSVEAFVALVLLVAIGRWAYRRRRETPADVPPVVGMVLNAVRTRAKFFLINTVATAWSATVRAARRARTARFGGGRFLPSGRQEPERS